MSDLDPTELDPGIRALVVALNAQGWETTDSGDGVTKEPSDDVCDFPHVAVALSLAREIDHLQRSAHALLAEIEHFGLKGWVVEASYSTRDGVALLFAYGPKP